VSSFTDPDSPEFLAKIEGLRSGISDITEIARLVKSNDFDSAVVLVLKVFKASGRGFLLLPEFEESLGVLIEQSPEAVEQLEEFLGTLFLILKENKNSRSLVEKVIFLSRLLNQSERFTALFEELNQGDGEPFEFNSAARWEGIELFLISGRTDLICEEFPNIIRRFFLEMATLEGELLFIRLENKHEAWKSFCDTFEGVVDQRQVTRLAIKSKLCFRLALEYGADDIAEYIGRRVCAVLQDDQYRADLAEIARGYGRDALASSLTETLEKQ
jgi:hypothetical protein